MLVMCDIDCCIADVRPIGKYLPDWNEYFSHLMEAVPIDTVIEVVVSLEEASHNIAFITGRPEGTRRSTTEWLDNYFCGSYELYMPKGSYGTTQEFKLAKYKELKPDLIIEDDPTVVKAAKGLGFLVLQVHGFRSSEEGDFTAYSKIPDGFTIR